MAGVDIWRFNEDGKAIEHWDVPPGDPRGHGQPQRPVLPTFLTD
jgi:hypothetical protein